MERLLINGRLCIICASLLWKLLLVRSLILNEPLTLLFPFEVSPRIVYFLVRSVKRMIVQFGLARLVNKL